MSRTLMYAAGFLLPLVALGDARFHLVDQANKVDGTYEIRDGKVRIQTSETTGMTMLYDAATHTMTVLDHDKKRYMRMDAETAAAAGAAVSDAMSEVEKQLATLPPEQREAMKQFLPQSVTGATGSLPVGTARRTGKSDTVAGASCDLVEVTMDGEAMGEACVATKGTSFLGEADQQTLHAMFQDMSKMASSRSRCRIDWSATSSWPMMSR